MPYTENLFLRIYWDKEKPKIKQGKYGYCKLKYLPWLHSAGLKYSFAHEMARENFSFPFFIDCYNPPEKHSKRLYSDTVVKNN